MTREGGKIVNKNLVAFCTAFLVILCCVAPGRGQDRSDIEALLSRFQDAMRGIADERKCAVIVEGQPSPVVLSKRKTEIQATFASPSSDLEKITLAYDYSVSRVGNLVILQKRYSYPQEMPCITPQECGFVAQDILTTIRKAEDSSAYPQDTESNVSRILSGFSQERQKQLLKGQAVPIAEFPPLIRRLTWGVMTEQYIVPITQNLGEPTVALMPDFTVRRDGDDRIVYEFTLKGLAEPSKYPIERARVITTEEGNSSLKETSDSSEITVYQPKTRFAVPLSKAMELVNRQAQAEYSANPKAARRSVKYAVAPYLEKKPVSIFGISHVSASELGQGIAKVYGLRIRVDNQGDVTLARRTVQPLLNIAAAIRIVQEALPDPLKRALHQAEIQELLRRQRKAETDRKPHAEIYALAQERESFEADHAQLLNEASWQLVTLLEKRFSTPAEMKVTKAEPRVTLQDLSAEEDSRLAVFLARSLINLLTSLREPAWYVSRFDEMSMAFAPENGDKGETKGTLIFGLADASTGKIVKPLIFISRVKD